MPEVAWPSSFASLSESLSSVFNVDGVTQLGGVDCLVRSNYCTRALNAMLLYTGFVRAQVSHAHAHAVPQRCSTVVPSSPRLRRCLEPQTVSGV